MKKNSTSPTIPDDLPISDEDFASGKMVLRQRGPNGVLLPLNTPRKLRVNMYLDQHVVEHFKGQAGGRGYQTLINEALSQAIEMQSITRVVRDTIREELRRAA